jgi:hypothetical protein
MTRGRIEGGLSEDSATTVACAKGRFLLCQIVINEPKGTLLIICARTVNLRAVLAKNRRKSLKNG